MVDVSIIYTFADADKVQRETGGPVPTSLGEKLRIDGSPEMRYDNKMQEIIFIRKDHPI